MKNFPVRFWSKVNKNGPFPKKKKLGRCWVWTAGLKGSGYGQFFLNGKNPAAHVVSYKMCVGAINPGHVVDHLCAVKRCVRPSHLQAKTQSRNMIAYWATREKSTACTSGHPFNKANTFIRVVRVCRTCERARSIRRYYEGRK